MKIPVTLYPEPQHTEVEIGTPEIRAALLETPDSKEEAFMLLNRCNQVFNAITDELIAKMQPTQRAVVAEYFEKQIGRYKPGQRGKEDPSEPAA